MTLKFIGTQDIKTERLLLRRFRESDAQMVFDNWASDKVVTKYLTWPAHRSVEVTKNTVNRWVKEYENPTCYHWAITLKNTEDVVGDIIMRVNEDELRCEIGYCLSRKCWNKGIMTEALKALIKFGFEVVGYERIESYHDVENPASGRVMQKAGMHHEGTLRRYAFRNDGVLGDCEIYAIIKDDERE